MLQRWIDFIPKLEEIGIPVAFQHFKEEQILPYAAWLDGGTNNTVADNQVYYVGGSISLELYFKKMDTQLIKKVENLLTVNLFIWERMPAIFLDQEKMYITVFTIR